MQEKLVPVIILKEVPFYVRGPGCDSSQQVDMLLRHYCLEWCYSWCEVHVSMNTDILAWSLKMAIPAVIFSLSPNVYHHCFQGHKVKHGSTASLFQSLGHPEGYGQHLETPLCPSTLSPMTLSILYRFC